MPLLLKKCLGKKYRQEADYEIFTGKTLWKTSVCTKNIGTNLHGRQKYVKEE